MGNNFLPSLELVSHQGLMWGLKAGSNHGQDGLKGGC